MDLKKIVEKRARWRYDNDDPRPTYGLLYDNILKHWIKNKPEFKQAYREVLEEKLQHNDPEGLPHLLRLTQEVEDIEMANRAYRWAYPDYLSLDFLAIHLRPLPSISVGVAAAELFDATQHGYGFYVELMERTPNIFVYKACMKALAKRDLEVFRETVERTMKKFEKKELTEVKRRRTEYINKILSSSVNSKKP